ncbi:hypothetical protein L5515_016223 [Caenorhabditis briggsae]|uniref:Uncharacterized protein n=1 Tax=Caenorhabditis briggsae TaxID=6238 RepID=A0AAE9FAM6_CAEBR|nr:hypothetical protein L5515_016223 [Caenorhabditis briggsae]
MFHLMKYKISSSPSPSASEAPYFFNATGSSDNEIDVPLDEIWPYTVQSTILVFLFVVWMIIGVFVAREVMLVILDHRKIRRKPLSRKRYNGAYSVKKKRYVNDKNYEAVANGGNEIV